VTKQWTIGLLYSQCHIRKDLLNLFYLSILFYLFKVDFSSLFRYLLSSCFCENIFGVSLFEFAEYHVTTNGLLHVSNLVDRGASGSICLNASFLYQQ